MWHGPAPARIAEQLGLAAGSLVVERRRVHLADGMPWFLSTSWFPQWIVDLAPILLEPRNVVVQGGILASVGQRMRPHEDEITPRPPTEHEIRALRLPPLGVSVAEHWRTSYNAKGQKVRTRRLIAPGDRVVLTYELLDADD